MGCVQQAVLEFDEEVSAPWRPRLVAQPPVAESVPTTGELYPFPPRPSRPRSSRVGVCSSPALPASTRPASARHVAAAASRRPAAASRRPAVTARRAVDAGLAARGPLVPAGRRKPERLRLTYRARRLAVVMALAAGVALGAWVGPLLSGGAGGDLRLAGQSSVTVESGDTLWSIASSVAGRSDVRAVVDRIRQLNGLRSADLVPGQILQLP